jgi:hypothetical protein
LKGYDLNQDFKFSLIVISLRLRNKNYKKYNFSGHALLQNVEVTTNSSRFDLRKWTHHKFAVRRYDKYYVKLLDWTLHMGYSSESMCIL